MPDAHKAKERRRKREEAEKARISSAPDVLAQANESSKALLVPQDYYQVAHREDPFLQAEVALFKQAHSRNFVLKVNGRVLGPFYVGELKCIMDFLRNDVDLK